MPPKTQARLLRRDCPSIVMRKSEFIEYYIKQWGETLEKAKEVWDAGEKLPRELAGEESMWVQMHTCVWFNE